MPRGLLIVWPGPRLCAVRAAGGRHPNGLQRREVRTFPYHDPEGDVPAISWIEQAPEDLDATASEVEKIMAIWVGGSTYENAPEGLHQAACCDVIDLGLCDVAYKGTITKKRLVKLVWQLADLNSQNKRYTVSRRYTASLDTKASLYKDLRGWRGRDFTAEELAKFDLENVLGKPCTLQVQQVTKDAKTYSNVVSVLPPQKGTTPVAVSDYVRLQDRKPGETQDVPPEDVIDDQEPVPF